MKYYGKEKCRILKQIRAEIARNNEIDYVIEECPYQGNCKGTCPKCEAEVRELEQKLEARRKAGKRVAVAGVAAGMSLSVMSGCVIDKTKTAGSGKGVEEPRGTACAPDVDNENEATPEIETLMGDMVIVPEPTAPGEEENIEMGIMLPDDYFTEEPPVTKEPSPEPEIMGRFISPDYVIAP